MLMWTDWLANVLQRSTRTALVLIAVNLLPLLLVTFGLWDLQRVLLLYWLENGVIGIYNVVKIVCARESNLFSRLIMALFFTVHYGMFFIAHGIFLMAMLQLPVNMGDLLSLWTALPSGVVVMLSLLFLSHGYSTLWHYFIEGEYRTVNTGGLFIRPYARVVILHLTILGGGFVALAMNEPRALLSGLVLLKIVIDVVMHVRSHAGRNHQQVERA